MKIIEGKKAEVEMRSNSLFTRLLIIHRGVKRILYYLVGL